MQEIVPNSDIFTVDALYVQADLASIHLVRSNGRIAIIDTGTQYSVPQVEEALTELDLTFSHVDLIILTHIHLDHAGGAGTLMALCDNAKLVVHPKGARHMIDPRRLIAGTMAVYGEEKYKKVYGEISPIPEDRIIQPADGETIDFADRPLLFIDTPGHANHHHCIIDMQTNSIFTGDTMGLSYRALRSDDSAFLMVTTTPVQFNPQAMHDSIEKIMSYKPEWLYLTHYSAIKPNTKMIAGLHEQIDDLVMLTQQCAQEEDSFEERLTEKIAHYLVQRCLNEVPQLNEKLATQWLAMDAKLNAQGLVFWWNNKRA